MTQPGTDPLRPSVETLTAQLYGTVALLFGALVRETELSAALRKIKAERDDYKRLAEIADTLARECRIHESSAEAAEADNARLREALDKDLASILKGKPLTEPGQVFPGADAENYWRLRTQLGEAQAGRSIQMCEVYRQQAVKMQRKADADADQASIREKKLRDTIAALAQKGHRHD
jgi:hypothetical protein